MCVLLMNEGRRSCDSDLHGEAGSTRIPDQNLNRSRTLEEEEHGGHALLQNTLLQNTLLQNTLRNNNRRGGEGEEGFRIEEGGEMDTTSGACSPEPDGTIPDSSSLSSSPTVPDGALSPDDAPAGVFSPADLSPSIAASLRLLEEGGDDAALPHRLHQIAETLMQDGDYERAIRFLQLERLYHERVLSNIAALQDSWESRWSSVVSSPALSDLESEHLDRLKHICRTHRQPTRRHEMCESVIHGEEEDLSGDVTGVSELSCSPGLEMLEQDEVSPSESATAALHHQREPTHRDSAHTPSTSTSQAPPTTTTPDSSSVTEETKTELEPPTGVKGAGPGTDVKEVEPDTDVKGAGPDSGVKEVELSTIKVLKEVREETATQLQEEEVEQEGELEEEELEEALEALELEEELQRSEVTTLDELAKRIQVEEISPASGLVSILKRKEAAEGSHNPPPDRAAGKRRVRFHVPEEGLDQDEVGGDSWLLLLLLCLVTVVISVGGTALYCAFGDAHSSVCTDFSHNVDFYLGKVQRGVDEIAHLFSGGS
ncbi:consortin [Trichomycterus rosablanca]|uniref:consortin n=1 Tax=Trichomycterus rosablanca TaxID=2290929 RepID=UPI002F350471